MSRPTGIEPGQSLAPGSSFLHIVPDDREGELRTLRQAVARIERELAGSRARESEARHLALHDSLTDLPNQRFFRQCLETALTPREETTQPLAILYIDLNGFKQINDTHGHPMGDRFLQIVAKRLHRSMRAEDMVCRLGGDEFGCLISGITDRRRIGAVATKIGAILGASVCIDGVRLKADASIGIALSPADGTTVGDLIGHADAAMYRAKQCLTRYTFYREDAVVAPRLPGVTRGI